MKKILDRIWEWMKSTAWFQVVLLVGVVVAVVLSIPPITKGISNAVSDSKRVKYYENNYINYDTAIQKINALDNGGEEFAIMFIDPGVTASTDLEGGVQDYEDQSGAVKIYLMNISANEDNKDQYDDDEAWYNYYKVTTDMLTGFRNGSIEVYNRWKEATRSNVSEVEQDSDYSDVGSTISSILDAPTIMWFRSSSHIDKEILPLSNKYNPVTNGDFNYHIAKVYKTISDSSTTLTDADSKTMSGLNKFFKTSAL
jgi:hypothetical protein